MLLFPSVAVFETDKNAGQCGLEGSVHDWSALCCWAGHKDKSLCVESHPRHGDHEARAGQGVAPGPHPQVAQSEVCLTSLQVFLNPVRLLNNFLPPKSPGALKVRVVRVPWGRVWCGPATEAVLSPGVSEPHTLRSVNPSLRPHPLS